MTPVIISIAIKKVQVVQRSGHTDRISIEVQNMPTAFPELKYPTCLMVDARHGYGPQWCREVLGVEPEIIKIS